MEGQLGEALLTDNAVKYGIIKANLIFTKRVSIVSPDGYSTDLPQITVKVRYINFIINL